MNVLFLSLLASAAVAQQLLQFGAGGLPSCAQQCQPLTNAQNACQPSSPQPVTCFCQSAYLTSLKTTANGLCDSACTSQSDRNQLFSWYAGFCANGGNAAMASLSAATAGGATTMATQASTAVNNVPAQTTQFIPPATGTSDALPGSNEESGSWYVLNEHRI